MLRWSVHMQDLENSAGKRTILLQLPSRALHSICQPSETKPFISWNRSIGVRVADFQWEAGVYSNFIFDHHVYIPRRYKLGVKKMLQMSGFVYCKNQHCWYGLCMCIVREHYSALGTKCFYIQAQGYVLHNQTMCSVLALGSFASTNFAQQLL